MKLFKRNHLFKFLIPIVIIAGIFIFITKSRADAVFDIPSVALSQNNSPWWNNDYAFRQKIVPSELEDQVLKINHSQLVIDNKSAADGSDLKIISYSDSSFKEIPSDITNPDQVETYINFSFKGKDSELFLYYGNKSDLAKPNTRDLKYSNVNQTASLMEEEKTKLSISIQKKWNLKEKDSKLLLEVNDTEPKENSSYYFLLDNSDTPFNLDIQNNLANIDIANITEGNHKLFVIRRADSEIVRSNSTVFIVSKPIYIAWSIDWEGIDPGKQNLENVVKIANDYNIPLTHFFSPRTLSTNKISETRKKEIINWLKNRITNNGDALEMLMYFQYDMVQEAGVDAKYKEKSWDNGLSGYDIPGTVYNYDEYSKILDWGKQKIISAGLPAPEGYRAGGWFINEDNLKAVKNSGFLFDSSAVKPVELGENKMIQDWKITNISQPYLQSSTDKNESSESKDSLIEIPINGGDSYINSSEEILQNYTSNYSSNSFSNTSKLILYSSSPEWIETGKESLENLFATVSNFRYDIDRGPVKFVTLNDWYSNNVSR